MQEISSLQLQLINNLTVRNTATANMFMYFQYQARALPNKIREGGIPSHAHNKMQRSLLILCFTFWGWGEDLQGHLAT